MSASFGLSRAALLGLLTEGEVLAKTSGALASLSVVSKGDLCFNVMDYGATGDGTTDDWAAICAARDAAVALRTSLGNGVAPVVYAPRGTYVVSAGIEWYSGISFVGDGMGVTILKSTKDRGPVFWRPVGLTGNGTSTANPTTDVLWADFTIDGSGMTDSLGTYFTGAKAFVFQFMQRCEWRNVHVHDTPATGFGVDFLVDCKFAFCVADGCGRLNDGTDPGGAGFGIGTGGYANENVDLVGCVARENGTFGVFFERQDGANNLFSSYPKVVGGHFEDNVIAGIGQAGVKRLVVQGSTIHGGQYGIAFMPRLTDSLGYETVINGVIQAGATSHGLYVTYPDNTQSGRLTLQVSGGQFGFNGGDGICIDTVSGQTFTAVDILDPILHENNGAGLQFSGEGTVQRFLIRVHAFNNGKGGPVDPVASAGVAFNCAAVSYGRVTDSRCYDLNGTKLQKYGVAFATTCVSSHVVVVGNDLVGNGTAAVLEAVAVGSTQNTVEDNVGWNPRGVTAESAGASPWVYTAGAQRQGVNVIGGTVSLIEVANQAGTYATYATSSVPFELQAGQSCRITYTDTITAVKINRA